MPALSDRLKMIEEKILVGQATEQEEAEFLRAFQAELQEFNALLSVAREEQELDIT